MWRVCVVGVKSQYFGSKIKAKTVFRFAFPHRPRGAISDPGGRELFNSKVKA